MESVNVKSQLFNTRKLILLALFTGIIIVLQLLSIIFPIYPFKLNLVLVPIVIGAALINPLAGLWLGGVFGFVVLITSPDVAFFMSISPLATILVILSRGYLTGLSAGVAYRLFEKKNKTIAVLCAALVTPIVNTGIFILGLYLFFESVIGNVIDFFVAFVFLNFLIELGINLILCPTIVRLIQIGQKREAA